MSQRGPLKQSFDGDDGFSFVVCRICHDHRRVINSQHLSKHGTDRETYMEEYTSTQMIFLTQDTKSCDIRTKSCDIRIHQTIRCLLNC
jgi:sulfur relay (sulfurtransferase) complex TusBCD TusD component (DsrE family)